MNNDDYQRQQREQQRRADEERSRRAIEDQNRRIREQDVRNAEARRKRDSEQLGRMGGNPGFGSSVDAAAYRAGKRQHDAWKAQNEAIAGAGGGAGSSSDPGAESRNRVAKVILIVMFVVIVGAVINAYVPNRENPNGATDASSTASETRPAATPSTTYYPPQSSTANNAADAPAASDSTATQTAGSETAGTNTATDYARDPGAYASASSGNAATAEAAMASAAPGSTAAIRFSEAIEGSAATASDGSVVGTVYPASHKGIGGCDGQLVLNLQGLQFICPNNSSKSFSYSVNQVERVDDDGVQLLDGQKFHFAMGKASKQDVADLFLRWLQLARSAPQSPAN
jgi:hypothetical protein